MPQILEAAPAQAAAIRHVLDQVLTVVLLAETRRPSDATAGRRDHALCSPEKPKRPVGGTDGPSRTFEARGAVWPGRSLSMTFPTRRAINNSQWKVISHEIASPDLSWLQEKPVMGEHEGSYV